MVAEKKSENKNLIGFKEYLSQRRKFAISAWARTGVGKSHFALTAPTPMYLFNWEIDGPVWAIEHVAQERNLKEGDLYIDDVVRSAGIDTPYRDNEEDWKIYEYFQDQVKNILKDVRKKPDAERGTMIIDTQTTLWQTMYPLEMEEVIKKREAKSQELFGFDWQYGNRAMKKLIESIKAAGMNLVMLGHAENQYNTKGQKLPKKWQYVGNAHMGKWMDVHGQLVYDPPTAEEDERYEFIVEKCRMNRSLEDTYVEWPTFDGVLDALTNGDEE